MESKPLSKIDFLTKTEVNEDIVIVISGVYIRGNFIQYDHKANVLEIETKYFNGIPLESILSVGGDEILAWGLL